MKNTITLSKLIDELEMQSDEINCYFNKKENALVSVLSVEYCDVEENTKCLEDIENNFQNYISLPKSNEINEYEIMENFVDEQQKDIQDILNRILNGKRPFGRFKDKIFELDIREEWFEFKKVQLEKIALDWCEVNNIEIVGR
jgi:hypothetical protein